MKAGEGRWYQVVLTYATLPPVRTRVRAMDDEHAARVAALDATAKGWPREYQSADVRAES